MGAIMDMGPMRMSRINQRRSVDFVTDDFVFKELLTSVGTIA